jgi:hypothetical protein
MHGPDGSTTERKGRSNEPHAACRTNCVPKMSCKTQSGKGTQKAYEYGQHNEPEIVFVNHPSSKLHI